MRADIKSDRSIDDEESRKLSKTRKRKYKDESERGGKLARVPEEKVWPGSGNESVNCSKI